MKKERFVELRQRWLDNFSEMNSYDIDLFSFIKMKGHPLVFDSELRELARQVEEEEKNNKDN